MLFDKPNLRNLTKLLFFSSESSIFSLLHKQPLACIYTQKHSYVDVYMKWKKDSYYDSIESIHKSIELKPVISLKNRIAASPDGCIPISAVSKRGLELGVPINVARFLRQYPSVFEEFTGPKSNLPWFRLTPEAVELDREECAVYRDRKDDLQARLKKFILMSGEKRLPMKIILGMQWYLGLPDEYLRNPEANLDGSFRIVEMEDGLKGLAAESGERVLSVIQKNAMKRGGYGGGPMEAIAFPFFPSKGLRLKTKISNWLDEFQKLPYVSPYEDYSDLNTDSDVSEKRVVGLLHELLSLFVEHAAERKMFLFLRKYLGLPQKVHKAFERHTNVFYLSLRNKTCTAILKEAYCDKSAIEAHPLSKTGLKRQRFLCKCFFKVYMIRLLQHYTKREAHEELIKRDYSKAKVEWCESIPFWYTISAARACFLDKDVGSLSPGKLADFVVLSTDSWEDFAAEGSASVEPTYVGGVQAYFYSVEA